MKDEHIAYIFAYGSLADPNDWLISQYPKTVRNSLYGELSQLTRTWEIAINNASKQQDHKHYLLNNKRHLGMVASLGVAFKSGATINGVALPVNQQLLNKIDKRETVYLRSKDCRQHFSINLDSPLYIYLPNEQAKANFKQGLEEENVFLPKEYLSSVKTVFNNLDQQALERFNKTTQAVNCPVADLKLWREPGDQGI